MRSCFLPRLRWPIGTTSSAGFDRNQPCFTQYAPIGDGGELELARRQAGDAKAAVVVGFGPAAGAMRDPRAVLSDRRDARMCDRLIADGHVTDEHGFGHEHEVVMQFSRGEHWLFDRAVAIRSDAHERERLTEFNGVLGRLRELRNVRLGRQYEKGTIGWEATNEILKIDELIDARRKQWRSDVVDENELEEEVEFLRERRAHFDEFLRSDKDLSDFGVGHIDAPGEVTREAVEGDPPYPLPGKEQGANPNNYYYRKSGKDSPKYELARKPNANVSETPPFRVVIVNGKPELQPADKPPEHERVKLDRAMHATDVAKFMRDNTSLGPFADMVESAEIATREQIDEEISKAYAARDHRGVVFADMVRNDVKDLYREHVVRVLADPSLSDAVSHRQLRLLLADVNPSDRGNLVEAWYKRRFAPDATEHVAAEPTRVGENNKEYVDDRKIDLVERGHEEIDGEVIEYVRALELKDVAGEIDHDQFAAHVAMVKQQTTVTLEGHSAQVTDLKYVFTNSEGARANLTFMADAYRDNEVLRDHFTVEIFDSAGQRHTISNEQEARSWLSRLGGAP